MKDPLLILEVLEAVLHLANLPCAYQEAEVFD